MLGAVDMRQANFWIRTQDGQDAFTVNLIPKGDTKAQKKSFGPFKAKEADAFIVKVCAGPLEPGTKYAYEISNIKGTLETPANYRDRTPPPKYTVALGGGHYDNDPDYDPPFKTPGSAYHIFESITHKKPQLMVWLGDATILREGDWGSRSGIFERHKKARATKELQGLLSSVPNVAVIGAGETANGDRFLWNIADMKDAFERYWANPSFGVSAAEGNLATQLRFNDAEFFLLDDRSQRDMRDQFNRSNTYLGKAQRDWLIEALARSTATFKIIVSNTSLLNPVQENNDPVTVPNTREDFLKTLRLRDIKGVFFISGNRAAGETTKFVRANGYDLYDFCVGPLTARAATAPSSMNHLRMPGSTTVGNQFATLTFDGPEDARTATFTAYDSTGAELYTLTLKHEGLQ